MIGERMLPSRRALAAMAVAGLLLSACASLPRDAELLARQGRHEQALELLDQAVRQAPQDRALRSAWLRQRDVTLNQLAYQADLARNAGRGDAAQALLARLEAIDPQHPRVGALRSELERSARHDEWLAQARAAQAAGRDAEAEGRLQQVLAEAPGHPGARPLLQALRAKAGPPLPPVLGPAYQQPVTLEFRDAPLRGVLEGLARTSGVNFVFDKDVRGDARVTLYLKDVSIDDALKVILATQQLERKLLNESTVLIYPGTPAKQREHQELVTRSFYLTNADVKQAQTLVRTMAKTRDLFVDERLNLLVVRDTPEVVRLVERLLAGLDLAEPEVLLEVEVMEIASSRLDELGIQWPEQITYGLPGTAGSVTWGQRHDFGASVLNPVAVATLRNSTSRGNTLANPRLRARNREKAKIAIVEKLPVFTTTTTASGGSTPTIAATVTYLDVGLKLDVEPSVQLDNDVIMKVSLDVSTLIGRVEGPQDSVAYQVGTRQASTSLRLRDGETQILAGLIRDEDTKSLSGVPGLADLPIVGRLFGVHTDQRIKTEVVLLITPRVLRNLGLPPADVITVAAGVDASPGATSVRLAPQARAGVAPADMVPVRAAPPGGRPLPGRPPLRAAPPAEPEPAAPPPPPAAVLVLSTSGKAEPGGSVAVTLQNRSAATLQGELGYDPQWLESAQGEGPGSAPGRLPFALAPGGEHVFLLRVRPGAAGQATTVNVAAVSASGPDGQAPAVRVEGDGSVSVARP
jgi:general secretion pathway protein D